MKIIPTKEKPKTVLAIERPNTRFIYLRSQAGGLIQYDDVGFAAVPLDEDFGNVIDITGYRQISVLISSQKSVGRRLTIGIISGSTAAEAYDLPLDEKIHTFNVTGPEMSLAMNGPPNTQEMIQLWVYLRS